MFKRAEPGTRFQKLYQARSHSTLPRIAVTILGILLAAGGVVLLFIPGPGLLLIVFGAGLLAQRSRWLSRRLDRWEILSRRLAHRSRSFWNRATAPFRAVIVAIGVAVAGLAGYAAWVLFVRD